jgi:hypothetical protein
MSGLLEVMEIMKNEKKKNWFTLSLDILVCAQISTRW